MKCSRRDLAAYALTLILCLGILAWALQLWRADLNVPFGAENGDDVFYGMVTKSLIDNGWYLHNRFLSAPEGLDLEDFPITDTLHLALLKFICLWARNYAVALNIFFLLTFPLTAATSLFAFRALGLSYAAAIACSLLYTFLPYHFLRGEVHVFLAAYYLVPLMATLVLWMGLGTNGQAGPGPADRRAPVPRYTRPSAKLICVLVASGGTYYAFFGGFLLLVAGTFRASRDRTLRPLAFAGALVGILAIITVVNAAPTILYAARHGTNTALIAHDPGQAEYFGLRLPTLVLPASGHRIRALARIKALYNGQVPFVNENDWATLGVFATIGFFMLLWWLVCRRPQATPVNQLLDLLSTLNIYALLLAVIGGFGVLAAFLFPEVRSYNRMSVYIAFFSLAGFGIWLDHVLKAHLVPTVRHWVPAVLAGVIVAAGVFDQTTPGFVPSYRVLAAAYSRDTAYFERIEASLPKNAMVFELPYAEFPVSEEIHHMQGYELLRGYLHSRTLRWSYGAMSGRAGGAWLRRVSAQPLGKLLDTLAFAGFDGIYIDRRGYADDGRAVIDGLFRRLHVRPIVSVDGRLVFFDLDKFRNALRRQYGAIRWRQQRNMVLRPLGLEQTGSQ